MHAAPQQAAPLPAQRRLVRWTPHKAEKKAEFLPTSAVFSLRQVWNQNTSASTHAWGLFYAEGGGASSQQKPARHLNLLLCGFLHPPGFLSSSPRGYCCNCDDVSPCHSSSLTSFPFHQSQNSTHTQKKIHEDVRVYHHRKNSQNQRDRSPKI